MQKFRPNLLPSDPSFAFQRKFATPIKNLFQRQLGLNFFWRRLVFFASHFHSRKIACSAACACVSVRVRACVCVLGVCACVCVWCVCRVRAWCFSHACYGTWERGRDLTRQPSTWALPPSQNSAPNERPKKWGLLGIHLSFYLRKHLLSSMLALI